MNLSHSPRTRRIAVLLAFVALSMLFFWRLWAPNPADRMSIGAADGDFARQFYPYRTFVAGAWGSGQVPLLNPHQYSGTPAWADPQQAVLYPWRLTQVPLAVSGRTLPLWAVEAEAVVHLALAGWFTFLLLRSLGAGRIGSAFGGVTFAFGGYATGYPVEQLAVIDTAVWVPAVLWVVTVALQRARRGTIPSAVPWAFASGAAVAVLVLAGHPQTAMYGIYAGAVWWLARGWSDKVPARRLIALGLVALMVAAGLSAAQWLPSAALSQRVARDLDDSELSAGLQVADIAHMVAPARLEFGTGDESATPSPGVPRGAGSWVPLFVGVVALGVVAWGAWRDRAIQAWVAAAGVAWLVSLGGNTPLYDLVFRWLPGFGMFRHQERIAVLFSLCLAVAAGLAVARILAGGRSAARSAARLLAMLAALVAVLAVIATVTADSADARAVADALVISALALGAGASVLFAGARGSLSMRSVGWALVAIAALELFTVNHGRVLGPAPAAAAADPVVAALQERVREGRVSSEALLPGGPNAASIHGLYDTTGDSPMQLRRHALLVEEHDEMMAWRLQAVRFVVSDREFPPGAPVSELAASADATLYEVQLPAPPVWVTTREAAAGVEGVEVVIADGEAVLVGLDPGRAVTDVSLPQTSLVVLSTVYDSGWRATAQPSDGSSAPVELDVEPAYGVLAAASLPAGAWRIEWTYRPREVEFGLALTGATLLLGALWWAFRARRRQ